MKNASKRLAVVFPGIGYTADRSLLYYGKRLAERFGYESVVLCFRGFPKKLRGDGEGIRRACALALKQAEEQLREFDLTAYEDVVFLAKSIGTAAAAAFAAGCPARERIRLVLFTPLEESFAFPMGEALAFTGTADPWTGGEQSRIPALCEERAIPCLVVPGANHSLETGDVRRDLQTLREAMERTEGFLRREQLRRIARHETLAEELRAALAGGMAKEALPGLRERAKALEAYYTGAD